MPRPKIPQIAQGQYGLLLTARTGANYLGISRSTFYEVSRAEGFPAPVEVPGETGLRWRREELRAWVRSLPSRSREVAA